MAKLVWRVKLVAERPPGVVTETELACIEHDEAVGLLAVVFGMLAPAFTGLMLAAPKGYIMALGGSAMLRVLQSAFVASFRERFTLGALVSFLVTVADLAVLNIGAAFWGDRGVVAA